MFNLNILRLSSIVLISLSSCLYAFAPASIQVLSPSEFDVILAPDENETLLDVRININREFGSGAPDYRKKNVTGRVIHFSERSLSLKRGDIIYYSLAFDDGDRLHGEDGNYIFDGVYKRPDRRRREVYEQSSEETSEEKNVNQDSESKESRYLRQGPRGHHNHHGPHHRHHFGPPRFFPPPFGVPHHPPPYPGPDSWREHGYEHKDKFGHHGPWEDNDSHDCDPFGHKPKYPGGEQRPDNRKPWRGGPEDNPSPDSNGNNGFDRPSGGKPNKGSGSGNVNPNESGDPSKNDDNTTTENPIVEVFTTRTTTTTATSRTTTVPDIDIRFRLPDDS